MAWKMTLAAWLPRKRGLRSWSRTMAPPRGGGWTVGGDCAPGEPCALPPPPRSPPCTPCQGTTWAVSLWDRPSFSGTAARAGSGLAGCTGSPREGLEPEKLVTQLHLPSLPQLDGPGDMSSGCLSELGPDPCPCTGVPRTQASALPFSPAPLVLSLPLSASPSASGNMPTGETLA